MCFISHLDMNRLMIRIVRKSGLDVWYTEGFNPHLYITFALPLSLGFEGSFEIMDMRLIDDDFPLSDVCERLNRVSPEGIHFFECAEPIKKVGEIAFASYEITFDDGGEIAAPLSEFLKRDSIICRKKTKKGDIKEFDIAPKLDDIKFETVNENTRLSLTLPAGSNENINPELLLDAYFEQADAFYQSRIHRTAVFDRDKRLFK